MSVPDPPIERWPPSYDADQLKDSIKTLSERADIRAEFFSSAKRGPAYCQGDVIWLESDIPLIGEDGTPCVTDAPGWWLIVGNTCDLYRDLHDVEFSQIVPLRDLGAEHDLNTAHKGHVIKDVI